MHMAIDTTGKDIFSPRIDYLPRTFQMCAKRHDLAFPNANVGDESVGSGGDGSAADD
jgi:hypothetical protein